LEKEEYKDYGVYELSLGKLSAEKKVVAGPSYGHRLRIAKLFENHEPFMYHIITVAGWARTVRPGSKEFCFIELHDGSS
jgi:hypothetical protein